MSAKAWNVIFWLDQNPPTKLVLLTRSSDKSYAPNWKTGIGGKLDPGETALQSAQREQKEETGQTVDLHEFARVIILPDLCLYYFWGLFNSALPKTADGQLNWVPVNKLLDQKIIPTTHALITEWSKRNYKTDSPFTVILEETEAIDGIRYSKVVTIKPGLEEI